MWILVYIYIAIKVILWVGVAVYAYRNRKKTKHQLEEIVKAERNRIAKELRAILPDNPDDAPELYGLWQSLTG